MLVHVNFFSANAITLLIIVRINCYTDHFTRHGLSIFFEGPRPCPGYWFYHFEIKFSDQKWIFKRVFYSVVRNKIIVKTSTITYFTIVPSLILYSLPNNAK